MIRSVWRSRWGVLRLAAALAVLWSLVAALPARWARVELASLPDLDYVSEVRALRAEGRYGEAVLVADAGLDAASGPAAAALAAERERTVAERDAFLRRAKLVGLGALSGTGDSLEMLLGAIAADLFVVGDIRDLAIQGSRYVVDGETDGVILLLSGVGLATTVAPQADWAPSVLKVARKTGAMSRTLGEQIVRLVRGGRTDELRALLADVGTLASKATPGGAVRLIRHADNAEDVAALARFVERSPAGAFALHVTGKEGAQLVKRLGAGADDVVVAAARKGPAGVAWLRTGGYKALMRPHPVVGLLKGLYKGNVQGAAARMAERLGPHLWWAIPLAGAWVFLEAGLIVRRATERTPPESAGEAGGAGVRNA